MFSLKKLETYPSGGGGGPHYFCDNLSCVHMPNVVMLSQVLLSVCMVDVAMLSVCRVNVVLSVGMLSVHMPNAVMLSVVMLSVCRVNAAMLSVIT